MLLSWDSGESRSPVQEASSATDTDTNSQEDPGQQSLRLIWNLSTDMACASKYTHRVDSTFIL